MSHSATEPEKIAERRKQVWKLRVKGWSIREIADHIGVSVGTIHGDLEAVRAEVADETKSAALKHREIELARIDEWIRAGTEQLESLGEIRSIKEAADNEDAKLRVDTIAPLLNSLKGLSERRAKLLGLDAPAKSELTGADGGPLEIADAKSALLDKLSRLAIGGNAESAAGATDTAAEPGRSETSTVALGTLEETESDPA